MRNEWGIGRRAQGAWRAAERHSDSERSNWVRNSKYNCCHQDYVSMSLTADRE